MSQPKLTGYFSTRKRARQDDLLMHKEKRLRSIDPPMAGGEMELKENKKKETNVKLIKEIELKPQLPSPPIQQQVTDTTAKPGRQLRSRNIEELKQRISNFNSKLQKHQEKYAEPKEQVKTVANQQITQKEVVLTPIESATPAYLKYENLASTDIEQKLVLPIKYVLLFDQFKGSDTIMKFFNNRQEICTFLKLKNSVQNMTKKNFTLLNLGQIKTVYETAYIFKQEKCYIDYKNDYHLTITPNLSEMNAIQNEKGVKLMTPQILLDRLSNFKTKLFDMVKDLHQKFLKSIGLQIENKDIKRWHAKFDLEALEDVKSSDLPLPPNELKVKCGEDLINIAKDVYSSRVQNAINNLVTQQLKEQKSVLTQTPAPLIATDKKTAQYNALLEKVRLKEKQKELENMVKNSDKEKRLTLIEKYPDCVRFLKSYFQAEKKSTIETDVIYKKMSESLRSNTPAECEQLVKELINDFSNWISFIKVRKAEYLKLDKSVELQSILTKIDSIMVTLK